MQPAQVQSDELGLRVEAAYRSEGGAIRCSGAIEDTSGKDRGLDLVFCLPVGTSDWRWGRSIREEVPLADGTHVQASTTFSSVSAPKGSDGVALAVPADSPCDCGFRHDKAFVKRAKHEGLWRFGSPTITLPDPQNYTFHEGRPGGWEFDDAHDIYTCPYIIPGQRELTRLKSLPASREEALRLFRAFQPPKVESANRPGKTVERVLADRDSRGWGATIKPIIENCMLYDADDLPQMSIRNSEWGGNSITFPLAANPRLLADTDEPARMEHYYHLTTFYGIYPSFANMRVYKTPEMYAPVAALNNRFVPVLREITNAGWQPIPHARSSCDDVWLERWGPDPQGAVYLTVYNASKQEQAATLTVNATDLGLTGSSLHAEDRLSGETWQGSITDGVASLQLSVPPEQVRVLRLRVP